MRTESQTKDASSDGDLADRILNGLRQRGFHSYEMSAEQAVFEALDRYKAELAFLHKDTVRLAALTDDVGATVARHQRIFEQRLPFRVRLAILFRGSVL